MGGAARHLGRHPELVAVVKRWLAVAAVVGGAWWLYSRTGIAVSAPPPSDKDAAPGNKTPRPPTTSTPPTVGTTYPTDGTLPPVDRYKSMWCQLTKLCGTTEDPWA